MDEKSTSCSDKNIGKFEVSIKQYQRIMKTIRMCFINSDASYS